MGITYKPVRIEFTVKNPETLSARRMLFAQQLAMLVYKQAKIIYLDETSVNFHMRQARAWTSDD